ncbi:MAG: hypothetical protein ACRDKI_05705 [Solirubrobacterales bacterium]
MVLTPRAAKVTLKPALKDHRLANGMSPRPLLFIDVDGVISTYFAGNSGVPGVGGDPANGPAGRFHMVDGIVHHIAEGMDRRIAALLPHFESLWATGWGERANEHLVYLLSLPGELEVVEFAVAPSTDGSGHWKLDALIERAGDTPAAWIDDGHNEACIEWASSRKAPTLLISTDPFVGLTDEQVDELVGWAAQFG